MTPYPPPLLVAFCLAALSASPRTQQPPTEGQEPITRLGGRESATHYSESTSRKLFSACDADGDDRLDLFEACDAIDTLGDPTDPSPFRILDRDCNGYIEWPEFDAHFQGVIERGHSFHVRTCRLFVRSAPELREAKAATPLDVFFELNDENGDGGLDPSEVKKIVRDIGLLPIFETQLRTLDSDQSGRIERDELAPWFEQIRTVIKLPALPTPAPPNTPSGLAPPWAAIDANGDNAIDLLELERALRRLDPGLVRWADHLLKQRDRNHDGKLGGAELGAQHEVRHETATSGD